MTDKALEAARECPWHGDNSNLTLEDNGVGCFWVVCGKSNCGCEGPYADSVEAAVSAWNRRAPVSALPGEAEVVGWAYRGPRGGLIVTEEKPEHAPEAVPLVTLASLQAMQARAEKAERERDDIVQKYADVLDDFRRKTHRAEAAEARVKELEEPAPSSTQENDQ